MPATCDSHSVGGADVERVASQSCDASRGARSRRHRSGVRHDPQWSPPCGPAGGLRALFHDRPPDLCPPRVHARRVQGQRDHGDFPGRTASRSRGPGVGGIAPEAGPPSRIGLDDMSVHCHTMKSMRPFEPGVPSVVLSIRVPASLQRELAAEAKRRKCGLSFLVRDLVASALGKAGPRPDRRPRSGDSR